MRAELERMATGAATLRDLDALKTFAYPFKFVPIAERAAERPHAEINRRLHGKRKRYPLTVSMALRAPEIEDRILDGQFATRLAETVLDVGGNSKTIARVLRLHHHRSITDMIHTPSVHASLVQRMLVPLIYRTHPTLQFMGLEDNEKAQTNKNRFQQRMREKFREQRRREQIADALPEDQIRNEIRHEHFREVVRTLGKDAVISFQFPREHSRPYGSVDMQPLADALQPGAAPGPIPTTSAEAKPLICDDGADWEVPGSLGPAPATPPEFFQPFAHAEDRGVEAHIEVAHGSETIFFQVQDASPGKRHVVPMAPASGMRLGTRDVVLTMHRCFHLENLAAVIGLAPLASGESTCDAVISSDVGRSGADFEKSGKLWQVDRISYAFSSEVHQFSRHAATEMVKQQAWPGTERSWELVNMTAGHAFMTDIYNKGFVTKKVPSLQE